MFEGSRDMCCHGNKSNDHGVAKHRYQEQGNLTKVHRNLDVEQHSWKIELMLLK